MANSNDLPCFSYLAVVECVHNRHAFFAKVLQNSTKSFLGIGRRDSDLIRLIVTRAECDMVEIKVSEKDKRWI